MSTHAQAKFEVQSWDENAYDELEGDAKLTRASVGQGSPETSRARVRSSG